MIALALLLPLLLGACGGRGGHPPGAAAGSARGAVSLERVVGRTGPGEGFAAAATLRRGEAVFVVGAERGFARVRRSAADGPEAWIPLGSFETDAAREERERRTAAAKGLPGEAASAGPSGATVLLAPDWGAARWESLAEGDEVQVLFAAHEFFAVSLPKLPLAFVPARDVRLRGAPLLPEPGSTPADSTSGAEPSTGTAPAGARTGDTGGSSASAARRDGPWGIPASGFETEPPQSGPFESLPPGSEAPVLKSRVDPRYPEVARRARISGDVVLRVVVEADGSAGRIQVVSGAPLGLTEAAEEAVRKWTWTPARVGGRPVAAWRMLRIRFTESASTPPASDDGAVAGDRPL